ncbi:MAG: 5'-3' exonuclease [Longimicrobiales bacterium]
MIVHLIDGTFELFRHFYAPGKPDDLPVGDLSAARGVVATVLGMLEDDVTHIGVATDHVIESFRNALWPGYKTGEGIDPGLWAQFWPLEDALEALGVTVWPMVEFEADDALAAAAAMAATDPRVDKVVIWTPDKDLGQCVVDDRVVQVDRRANQIRNAEGVRAKFGVPPASIPDLLALVGDSADGYPGLPGWGAKSAAALLAHYGDIESIPEHARDWTIPVRGAARLAATLAEERETALLFRTLARLRTDALASMRVDDLRWRGPRPAFAEMAERLGSVNLMQRAASLAEQR